MLCKSPASHAVPHLSLAVHIQALLRPCYSPLSFSVSLRSGSVLRLRVRLSSGHSITLANHIQSPHCHLAAYLVCAIPLPPWLFQSMPFLCHSCRRSAPLFLFYPMQCCSVPVPLSSLPILRRLFTAPLRLGLACECFASAFLCPSWRFLRISGRFLAYPLQGCAMPVRAVPSPDQETGRFAARPLIFFDVTPPGSGPVSPPR